MQLIRTVVMASFVLSISATQVSALTLLHDVNVNFATAAGLTPTVDQFRTDLGNLNANDPVNGDPAGRRQINWDAAPDAVSDPNPFPGNFFNFSASPRARGIEFQAAGATTGFLLSSTAASGQPVGFGFGGDFVPFSAERLFAPIGDTLLDVLFFDPADQVTPATTRGFGIIFSDVETAGSTSISLFDINDNLLATRTAAEGANASLTFVGLIFDDPAIARVRIDAGDAALLSNGSFLGGDAVVMDDVIFGEPIRAAAAVPLPATLTLLFGGLLGLGAVARRQRRRA